MCQFENTLKQTLEIRMQTSHQITQTKFHI